MSEMIERVTLAFCEHLIGWDHDHLPPEGEMLPLKETVSVNDLRELARAAIEAMREPTPYMIYLMRGPAGHESVAREAWRAGIDAALKD